ncbi:hypothetical protein LPJ76_003467 [Coemansia sp. RSA 638]|nr:hypothetical protein LPJ76_003467 [Coemansia sp. RSA 638]
MSPLPKLLEQQSERESNVFVGQPDEPERYKLRQALQQRADAENEEGQINTKKARPLTEAEVDTLRVATLTQEDINISKRLTVNRTLAPLSVHSRTSTDLCTQAMQTQRSSMFAQPCSEIELVPPPPAVIAKSTESQTPHDTPLQPHRTKSTPLLALLKHKISSRRPLRKESIEMSKLNSQIHEENCAVCLDDFAVGDKVRMLPCQHYFHVLCIDPWLMKSSAVCPLCNLDVSATFNQTESSCN